MTERRSDSVSAPAPHSIGSGGDARGATPAGGSSWLRDRSPDSVPSSSFDGEDFLFHLYRGNELLQDNCVSEAKEELEAALAMQPRDIEGQGLLGVVYFRLGLYPRAIQIYQDLIRACPEEVAPRINLALCFLKTGQSPQARDALEDAIRLVPDHTRAWAYLGLVYQRLGDYQKALASFERAGQLRMVQRMQELIEQGGQTEDAGPERAEVRRVAEDAVQELEDDERPFEMARAHAPPSRSGRWRAVEPGQEPVLASEHAPGSQRAAHLQAVAPPKAVALEAVASPSALVQHTELPSPARTGMLASERLLVVRVDPAFAARSDAVRALMPERDPFKTAIVQRRARGGDLAEPFGAMHPVVRFEGAGHLLLVLSRDHHAVAVELSGEFLYLREERVLGFQATARFENGRLPSSEGDHVAMVQLSGRGIVTFEVRGRLGTLAVTAPRSVVVSSREVVGWTGRLLPQALAPNEAPASAHGYVTFSGNGAVFLELG
jgi:thioredoxin-like negative regulator of GroEL